MKTLDERKQKILQAIIHDYLETAQPVGSRHIWRKYRLGVSPATIRNEMADLEEEGFLKHPYTSAGRIPSDKGYRYYVDHLMRAGHLTQREEITIDHAYTERSFSMDNIIHQTLHILSRLTPYAAMMMTRGKRENRVYYHGISNIASQPEFSESEHLKHILKVFEEETLLSSMLNDYSEEDDVTIRIGSENKYKEIRDCSVVVTSCRFEEDELGSIGILGPTRMFYDRTRTVINHISERLSSMLSNEYFGGH